jgi:hypothetical protein
MKETTELACPLKRTTLLTPVYCPFTVHESRERERRMRAKKTGKKMARISLTPLKYR